MHTGMPTEAGQLVPFHWEKRCQMPFQLHLLSDTVTSGSLRSRFYPGPADHPVADPCPMSLDESRISQLHAAALFRLKANVDTLLRPGQAETSEAGSLPISAGTEA